MKEIEVSLDSDLFKDLKDIDFSAEAEPMHVTLDLPRGIKMICVSRQQFPGLVDMITHQAALFESRRTALGT